MKVRRLDRVQIVGASLEEAWGFFSDPRNLRLITPPWLGFEITGDLPERIHPGLIIAYRVHPLFRIPMTWVTEITHVREPHFFVDEQRVGPYRLWHHQHHLEEVDGGVAVRDVVHYALPLGPLGSLLEIVAVRRKLREIFDYRRRILSNGNFVNGGRAPAGARRGSDLPPGLDRR